MFSKSLKRSNDGIYDYKGFCEICEFQKWMFTSLDGRTYQQGCNYTQRAATIHRGLQLYIPGAAKCRKLTCSRPVADDWTYHLVEPSAESKPSRVSKPDEPSHCEAVDSFCDCLAQQWIGS